VPLTIVLIWYGGLAFAAVLSIIAGFATRELFTLAEARGTRPLSPLGIPLAMAFPVLAAVYPTLDRVAPIALVVVVASVAAPLLDGSLRGARLDADADRLADEWSRTRLDAINQGRPLAFRATLNSGECQVTTLGPVDAPGAGFPRAITLENATFVGFTVGDPAATPTTDVLAPAIVFQPDGSATDAEALLQSDDGRQRRVVLRGLTGGVRVEDPEAAPAEAP